MLKSKQIFCKVKTCVLPPTEENECAQKEHMFHSDDMTYWQ